jgi:hypothetical protein
LLIIISFYSDYLIYKNNVASSTDIGKISNIVFNPDPPKKGKSLNIVANFTLTEQVTSGEVKIAVKWGFIPIKKTENLCDLIQQAGQTCPIASGNHQITTSVDIPKVPSGHYTGSVKAIAEDSKEIVCVDLDIHL